MAGMELTPAEFVTRELSAVADPVVAPQMQAYMKSEMPFWGVKKPGRVPIAKALTREFPPADAADYRRTVRQIWDLPRREDRYLAIAYARAFTEFQTPEMLDLYAELVRDGAWWDFVDEIAINLVGMVWLRHRPETQKEMDLWIRDENLWIRRCAIIGQLKHKEEIDTRRLYRYCREQASDTDFFIRKAIGWALRQQARIDPDGVRSFLAEMGDELSGLSRREAAKHL